MTDSPNEKSSLPPAPVPPAAHTPAPVAPPTAHEPPAHAPVKRVPPRERRDFFSDAMREVLSPFAGIVERKINPLLQALESIPEQAERLAKVDTRALDQLHSKVLSLPVQSTPAPKRPERHLRPPGALPPGEFETVCSRCGDCVAACPADAIRLDAKHLTTDGFPYIVAEKQPCVVCESLACMKSCPSGALHLVDVLDIDMGTAVVDHTLCLRDHGENCTLCIDACPILDNSEPPKSALFASPLTGKVVVRKNICIGCGLCESRCPTDPQAITVLPYKPPADPIIA